MFEVPSRVRYALRALTDIGEGKNEKVSIQEISKNQGISKKYLENIFHQLKNAGILSSVRGPNGGYRLAKDPEKISIYDIVEALEGPVDMVHCLDNEGNCSRVNTCPSRSFWGDLRRINRDFLSHQTLEMLVQIKEGKDGRRYESGVSG
jgi:Rrf2 family protein